MQHARSAIFIAVSVILMVFVATTGLLTAPLPFRFRFAYLSSWGYLTLRWLKWTCHVDYVVEGRENIPTESAGLIFCKHSSTWETLVLQEIFPPQVWVLKRELMWVPVFGWGLALLRPIAINRRAGRRAVEQIIEQGIERLKRGAWVVIFPEGTRVPAGQRRKWGIGGAALAEQSGCPVVPVAHDAGYYWARRQLLKRPGTIRLVIGPPIDSRGLSAEEINRRAREWVDARMAEFEKLHNNQ